MEYKRYTSDNGFTMIKCLPLNWRVENKYVIPFKNEINPEMYYIYIGSFLNMWQCSFNLENNIVSFTSTHYSNDEIYRFKVSNLEEVSNLTYQFSEGMNQLENLKDTI